MIRRNDCFGLVYRQYTTYTVHYMYALILLKYYTIKK